MTTTTYDPWSRQQETQRQWQRAEFNYNQSRKANKGINPFTGVKIPSWDSASEHTKWVYYVGATRVI